MGEEEAEKIKQFLSSEGIEANYSDHESVRTSLEAAKLRGFALKEGVKSLLFTAGKDQWAIVALPADKRVDKRKVAAEMGWRPSMVRLASQEDVLEKTGCEVGGVPPFGHKQKLPILCDIKIFENEVNDFNIGLRTRSLSMKTSDLKKIFDRIGVRYGNFAEE